MTLTPARAAAALAERRAERDLIQANLLDLDNSFGKRLLAGAQLTGITKRHWESAAGDLTSIWDVFTAYSGVVQRAAELLDGPRRPSASLLETMTELLAGDSVMLVGLDVPLARRLVTASAQPQERVTLDVAVQRMTELFARVAETVSAAETVWNDVTGRLDEVSNVLNTAMERAADLADESLRAELNGVNAELRGMRDQLSSDPLALWQDGQVAVEGAGQLRQRAQAALEQTTELRRLRDDADRRIREVADLVVAAQACERAARQQYELAAQKILASQLPASPAATADLNQRVAELDAIRAAGRLQRLATEIALIENDATAATARWRELDASARALLDRRAELRGLLDAYQAKARRLGATANPQLARSFQIARELLWSAPCDLAASADAVLMFQNAVLGVQRGAR